MTSFSCQRKILGLEELESKLRDRGDKILVHCHGCFDFIHPGHIHHFEFAKSFGDILLVSLNADAFFVNKGKGRPVFSEALRAISLASLEVVDFVCVYPGFIPEKIFEKIRPNVYVKGAEYGRGNGEPLIPEEKSVKSYGGRVVFGPKDYIYSSSELIKAIAICHHKD